MSDKKRKKYPETDNEEIKYFDAFMNRYSPGAYKRRMNKL